MRVFFPFCCSPPATANRWTKFVREQAEAHGFAWAYWEFGAYDRKAGQWREGLLQALIP